MAIVLETNHRCTVKNANAQSRFDASFKQSFGYVRFGVVISSSTTETRKSDATKCLE